ncbi:MAG: hypothetical protein ACKOFW_21320 [Planctomycetaceae bacterium]
MLRHSSWMLLVVLLVGSWSGATGGEIDELRQQAKSRLKAAETAAREGRPDEAERLEREAGQLKARAAELEQRSEAERDQSREREQGELKERLEALRNKERHLKESGAEKQAFVELREQIAQTEKALKKLRGNPDRGPATKAPHANAGPHPDLEQAERRAHHLRVAAENLKAAEEHDLARKLMEQSEQILRKIREEHAHRERQYQAQQEQSEQAKASAQEVARLKRELEELRAELRALRGKQD